jgi:2-keto-4-pentenoate hydratase/2-oxohepta-3-ene-1,7-dioic acid hydratase in catechol pathway
MREDMRLASFQNAGVDTWGIVEGEEVVDVGSVLRARFPDLKSLIRAAAYEVAVDARRSASRLPLATLQWLPVIPNPDKILCVGLNYEMHRKETGRAEVSHPTIFARFANSQTAHLKDILRPRVSSNLDFEGELALVVGKAGRYIPRAEALNYVAGYACYNDGSVRDWQSHTHQFTPGKNFPQTGAFGPWMMTPDEMGQLDGHRIRTRLNDQVVQDALLGEMIFDIPTILEYCSSFTRLECGDVIATGTPGGVGVKRTPPLWMKPGDVVEVEIEGLGILRINDEPLSRS